MSIKSVDRHNRRVEALNKRNTSELRRAAQDGNLVKVQRLIRDGAIVNNVNDHWNGEPAIFGAIESQHYQTVVYIINSGADLKIKGKNGFTIFQALALEGEMSILLYIFSKTKVIEDYDIWECNAAGWNPLHFAVFGAHHRAISWLIENRPEDNNGPIPLTKFLNTPTKSGQTIIHIAAKQGHKSTITWLCKLEEDKNLIDVNAISKGGDTALHVSSAEGNVLTTRALIENGADIWLTNRFGFLPLHLAASNSQYNCFVELMAWHTRQFKSELTDPRNVINRTTKQGWTVLMLACREGCTKIVEKIIPLKPKANEFTNQKRLTALLIAAMDGHAQLAQLLIHELDADVDLQNAKGETPLMLACKNGNLRTATCLLENEASPNLEDVNGNTALHHASMHGHVKCIECLSSFGAKIEFKNAQGESAARIAFKMGHVPCIQALSAVHYYDLQQQGELNKIENNNQMGQI
jgi:ankyrin repeat protein